MFNDFLPGANLSKFVLSQPDLTSTISVIITSGSLTVGFLIALPKRIHIHTYIHSYHDGLHLKHLLELKFVCVCWVMWVSAARAPNWRETGVGESASGGGTTGMNRLAIPALALCCLGSKYSVSSKRLDTYCSISILNGVC